MKKIYALIALAITSFGFAQTVTIFSENIGTATSTTTIANNTFQNTNLTFSGTADVRNTSVSSTTNYSTASGGANVMVNATNEYFMIENINTSNFNNITLSFGQKKGTNAANNELTVEVSSNGTDWTTLSYTRPTGSNTAVWALISPTGTIPSTENLRIKFTGTNSTEWRIDDILLQGEETPVEPVAPTASFDLQDALTISPSLDDASSFFGNAVVTIANLGEGQTASLSLENTENFIIITPEVTDLGNGTHSIQIRFNAQGLAANTYTTNLNVEVASQTTALAILEIVGVVSTSLSNNLNTIEGLNIYPNPANDVVTITSAANGVKNVQLFDVTGKQIMNVETSSTINVSSLAKGIYVMKVTEAGKSATSKLVIK